MTPSRQRGRSRVGSFLRLLLVPAGLLAACSSAPLNDTTRDGSRRGDRSGQQGLGGALQTVSVICGDGVRDPTKEECDDGVGAESDLCSSRCQVNDTLAAQGGPAGAARSLGSGRHPIAGAEAGFGVVFVEPDPERAVPAQIGLAAFDPGGDPRARIVVSAGANPLLASSPVVAALPGQPASFAVAWTDLAGDGDDLGVALRRVALSAPDGSKLPSVGAPALASLSPVQFANSEISFAQYDPDLIAIGDSLIVAWTDVSNPATAPDIRYRVFSADPAGFTAQAAEQPLAASASFENDVALAPFDGGWVAAWRSIGADGRETIEIADPVRGGHWSVGPHLPADSADHPALADTGDGRLLVLYTVSTDPGGTGTANVGKLRAALLAPGGIVTAAGVAPSSVALAAAGVSESQPSLVRAGSDVYLAWRSAAQPADPNAEELWLRRVNAFTASGVTLDPEQRMPRWPSGTPGDQRFPALGSAPPFAGTPALPGPTPSGALLLAWDDHGRTSSAGQGNPDVLVQLAPLPLLRFPTQRRTDCTTAQRCAAGEGDCDSNAECNAGLVCAIGAGPKFGWAPDVDICVPPHCANGVLDGGEAAIDCGGSDCGHCNCGDGVTLALVGEQCDDGNSSNTDDCTNVCKSATCGDGFVHAGIEACDTAGQSASCEASCNPPVCGDGIVNGSAGEGCEDGNGVNTDACVQCKNARCGDGFVWAGHEFCDSAGLATPGCDPDCTQPVCGDGVPNAAAGEACDDGNSSNTDACIGCVLARCGDGFVRTGVEACDDGNSSNTDACVACQAARCGDGFIWAGHETCDSNGTATATCDPDCTAPVCGDGVVNTAAGELCEPSLLPGCRADCKALPACTNGASCLAVQHIANGATGDNQVQPYFQIVNNGAQSVPLSQLKIRYFFTRVDDPNNGASTCQSAAPALTTFCDFAQIGCSNVNRTVSAVSPWLKGVDTFFDVTFTSSLVLAPGQSSGTIQLRLNRTDFANFVETDDYSFKTGTTFAFNSKVALYRNGTLVWGTEPSSPLVCGDGVLDHCESCDATHETASCNSDCSSARCGDGKRNASAGEACDTGGNSATCDADCTPVVCGDGLVNPVAGEVCEPSLAQGCLSSCTGFNGLVGCTNGGTCLKVQSQATDSATDNTVLPRLKIVNNGGAPIPLSQLSVRYWFTNDGSPADQSFCDFAALSNTNVNECSAVTRSFVTVSPTRPNADRYFEVRFTSAVVLAPGASTGEIQLRFAKVDASNFNENNDYSHRISSTYLDSTRITVYRNGVLIWGTPP